MTKEQIRYDKYNFFDKLVHVVFKEVVYTRFSCQNIIVKDFKILSKIYSLQSKYPLNVFILSWHKIMPVFFFHKLNRLYTVL